MKTVISWTLLKPSTKFLTTDNLKLKLESNSITSGLDYIAGQQLSFRPVNCHALGMRLTHLRSISVTFVPV